MRSYFTVFFASSLLCTPIIALAAPTALKSEMDKISYALGSNVGSHFKEQEVAINPQIFIQGLQDTMKSSPLKLSEQDMQTTLTKFHQAQMEKAKKRTADLAAQNLSKSNTFLETNKQNPKISTLPSGLQYEILSEGNGESPGPRDTVSVNYKGTLLDGSEFDSSYKRNRPASFQVDGVIPGWTEALQQMKLGSKWKLFIPPHLAYGEQGAAPLIAPNSALVFEVELLSIQKETEKPEDTIG